jgi:hypothetical protein
MELESISVSPTEQKITCHTNDGGSTDSDASYFVRSHVMLRSIVPIMVFSLCAAGH